jgi:cell division protease FtsH
MVTKYGFSENLGPIVYGNSQGEVFLGRDFNNTPNYSDNIAYEIDSEMRQIIESAYTKCEQILTDNMDKLHFLAKYLMKFEKIDGVLFEKIMKGEVGEEILELEEPTKKSLVDTTKPKLDTPLVETKAEPETKPQPETETPTETEPETILTDEEDNTLNESKGEDTPKEE